MQGIGTVQSVTNKGAKQFPVAMVLIDGQSSPFNMAYFNNSEESNIHNAIGKRIKVSWDEKPADGGFTNRVIKSFSILDETLQPPVPLATPVPQGTGTAAVVDQRQENINRQSSMAQAISIVTTAVANGYNIVQGEGKAAKAANKDPEVLWENAKYMAMKIKDFVQNGTWSNAAEETTAAPAAATEDDPF